MLPEWVLKYKKKGHKIVEKNGHYYLYKVTSRRVPGYKNPQPIDTYIGTITEDGLSYSKYQYETIDVKEFGLTYACLTIGKAVFEGKNDLVIITSCLSFLTNQLNERLLIEYKRSYMSEIFNFYDVHELTEEDQEEAWMCYHLIKEKLLHAAGDLDAIIGTLRAIYKVRINNKWYLSTIDEDAKRILNDLKIDLGE